MSLILYLDVNFKYSIFVMIYIYIYGGVNSEDRLGGNYSGWNYSFVVLWVFSLYGKS